MSKKSLENQADRADGIADQIVDDVLKETLRDAAREYREKRENEDDNEGADHGGYALFSGNTQLGRTFATEKEVREAALIEGLVTDVPVADEAGGQILPKGYHVERIRENYEPQPDWKSRG
ncbi:hypothetical protein [Bradyrhizobium sp. ARR65]|uniref:hypothetical protein n=1 Tax=Bradyrhizobium sp. ARR65 TaxID=1040989 RepID=UPI00046334DD|nr:hypothetical protein [Bradyrhizobium sp. ARR65]